jgi:transcriptional regulator with XRE-family HTH domain
VSDWTAVARAVNDRMRTLDLTQRELSERSGVSVATLRKIQQGDDQRRSAITLTAISRALGLADDHLRKIASGTAGATAVDPAESRLPERLASVEAQLAHLEKRMAALEGDDG